MTTKKIIFFDIDGTLLDEEKNLPITTKAAIAELQKLGHEVAIATGRAPYMIKDHRKQLNINTYISYNGQYVVLNGEVIYKNPLHKEALIEISEHALKNNHPLVYMDDKDMKANVPHHDHIFQGLGSLYYPHPEFDDKYHLSNEIFQTLLFCEEKDEHLYEGKYEKFDFVRWHPLAMDIVPQGGSKAIGIAEITNQLNISPENQYAFGDGLNDLEMLTTVPNSVAMENGHPKAKAAAKYVTKSVNDDGIVHGLKMVGLL